MEKTAWQEIQKDELAYHLRKDKEHIRDYKIPYWKTMMAKTEPFVKIEDDTRVLEVGCGCCGVVMALERGVLVGLDPLMDQYIENFDYLKDAKPTWVNGAAEETDFDEPFDVILNINALDHVIDPRATLKKIDQYLKPGGHFILSLNCHLTDFFRKYHAKWYKRIDQHHPHHFKPEEVSELLPGYELLLQEDIDELDFPTQDSYKRDVLKRKGIRWEKVWSYAFNPWKYPIAFARIFGKRPVHRKRAGQKAIFACYLFVFKKPETGGEA